MNSVGIDVSNGRRTVAVLRPLGEEVRALFEVRHDAVSLSALARELHSLEVIVMEHTGHYHSASRVMYEVTVTKSGILPILPGTPTAFARYAKAS